jgi:phosphoglycolate phosphatase-like HAD superfamily hydrolase
MMNELLKKAKERLKNFPRAQNFLIAIDSDGCVFDSMNPKQIVVFHPKIMEFYELWSIESYLREVAEFVNLFSKMRGCNRFMALQYIYRFLKERPDVEKVLSEESISLPDTTGLDDYIKTYRDISLGNPTLEEYTKKSSEPSLSKLLEWSKSVNQTIAKKIKSIPPFAEVRESLALASKKADLVVVSQTPYEALDREWKEHGLDGHVDAIAGQEMGKKADHIRIAAQKRYPPDKMLMIGDAPGDKKAADANGALFYPIIPGRETQSWKKLSEEALTKFFEGAFAGGYQAHLLAEFNRALPSEPPWQAINYDHRASYRQRESLRKALYERFDPQGRLLIMGD